MSPYFSVITPSFNQGDFIGNCLRSVVEQGDSDYEHLVYDNCSTDQTAAEVAKFPGVIFKSEADSGQSQALNRGFAAAGGEVICWLNSDDEYPAGVFSKLRQIFSDPEVMVVFGDARQIAYDGSSDEVAVGRFESRLDFVRWWSPDVKLHQPAVFFRRQVLSEVDWLREDLHYTMDYEFWWRLSEKFSFVYTPDVLAVQHRHLDSKTIRAWSKVLLEREEIFSPFYNLIDGGDRPGLLKEKNICLANSYLQQAYAVPRGQRSDILSLAFRAFTIRPKTFFELRWLGLIRKFLF